MRILAFAYACEPEAGSEPGVGWLWARMLARSAETTIITRANNRLAIEEACSHIPERDRLRFVYLDLPDWIRRWKRGQRGVRLYYVLWQLAALRTARKLHEDRHFDVVWHITLANAWLGSVGGLVGPPFVYGPVGGGVRTPWRLLSELGWRGCMYEGAREVGRAIGRYVNPLARIAWRQASVVLAQNSETVRWLPRRYRSKARVLTNAVLDETYASPPNPTKQPKHVAVFAGRLLPWKGVSLAIRAMSHLDLWTLLVVGSGPDTLRLRRLAARLEVQDRVRFVGSLKRRQLCDLFRSSASVLLFPSLHDDAGLVVPEAMACGVPVVCVNRGGPPLLVGTQGTAVEPRGRSVTARDLATAVARLSSTGCILTDGPNAFQIDRRADDVASVLRDIAYSGGDAALIEVVS